MTFEQARSRFRALHDDGFFVIPNPWDVGSAKLLASAGFAALATTSSGHAGSLGKLDQHLTRDDLVEHVGRLTFAVDLPINVDAQRCYGDSVDDVVETVDLLAHAGAAGLSIEDYDPSAGAVEPTDRATERVSAAADAAHRRDMLLTARAENHIYGAADLDDTIDRLRRYSAAGADVVFAPGLTAIADIERLVRAVDRPVNVLALPGGPSAAELSAAGVRRMSVGGSLAWAAYGALMQGAMELLNDGTFDYMRRALPVSHRRAFG